MSTCGEAIVRLLERRDVTHVFGIPGIHNVELYRGLANSPIRHIAPRHEQGAGFMADGYARVSGRPGVCFIVSGPGMTNIATAMGQAYGDSIPMLVISSVNARAELGTGAGHLHELKSQRDLIAGVSAFSHTLTHADEISEILDRAFSVFASARPRPVHIEIPVDVLAEPDRNLGAERPRVAEKPVPSPTQVGEAAALLLQSRHPVLIFGGGATRCVAPARRLAELLDAPAVMTINAKGLISPQSPLSVGVSPATQAVRMLIAEADVVLAVGTELGPTDFGEQNGGVKIGGKLIRVDIDPEQMTRGASPYLAIHGDALLALNALIDSLSGAKQSTARLPGAVRAAATRKAAEHEMTPLAHRFKAIVETIGRSAEDIVIVGDSTQPVYAANRYYEARQPGSWFNAATGYGTLGYALPAAIGAKIAAPHRAVVCLVGDGGLQFSIAELASAVEAGVPIAIVVWNNSGYGAIRKFMNDRGIAPVGVDIYTPDFLTIAKGFGCRALRPQTLGELQQEVAQAVCAAGPTLIELLESGPVGV